MGTVVVVVVLIASVMSCTVAGASSVVSPAASRLETWAEGINHEDASTTITTTTVTTPATRTQCGGVDRCLNTTECSRCLLTVNESFGFTHTLMDYTSLTSTALRALEVGLFTTLLSTSSCWPNETSVDVLASAIGSLTRATCQETNRMVMNICLFDEYLCFADDMCRTCLDALYRGAVSKAEAYKSPACRSVSPSLLDGVSNNCESFPRCTFYKQQCQESPECARCLITLSAGDGVNAARQCPEGLQSGMAMDNVVDSCIQGDYVSCGFLRQRCADNVNCSACLAAMGYGESVREVVAEWSTPSCQRAMFDPIALGILNSMTLGCPYISGCQSVASNCVVGYGDACFACLNGSAPPSISVLCNFLSQYYNIPAACTSCPDSVNEINVIVYATAVIGAASAVACLVVVATIVGHGRDRVSMRDRIIIGLMLANAVYSSANAIPLNALNGDVLHCGRLLMSFDGIRFGRGWWFCGKYALVSFELLIIGASIRALLRGLAVVPPRTEAVLHTVCWVVGVAAFVVFYSLCNEINNDGYNINTEIEALTNTYNHGSDADDRDDDNTGTSALDKFYAQRSAYDNLVREMLVVWDVLVGIAIVLWVVLRLMYRYALRALRLEYEAMARAEMADEWADTRRSAWGVHYRLLYARRLAFVEVAEPLELYIAVFVLFAAPAFVMSTKFCQSHSGAQANRGVGVNTGDVGGATHITYGTCDAWCEFVLAFRSLGAVVVYLLPHARRAEMVAMRTTWKKLRVRLAWCLWGASGEPYAPLYEMHALVDQPDHDPCDDVDVVGEGRVISEHDITMVRRLGEGAFGDVWEGVLQPDNLQVAIKVLFAGALDADGDLIDPNADEEFRKECTALQRINSPHLLTFYGYGTIENGRNGFIVTELMRGGSLAKVLHDHDRDLPWRTRMSIALQVALGMEHLHGRHMLHRDLKSANILVDEQLRAKVCDFGLARVARLPRQQVVHSPFTGTTRLLPRADGDVGISDGQQSAQSMSSHAALCIEDARGVMTRATGTLLWMAPEMFRGDRNYGQAVDVYSFGIVMWELTTRITPWSELPIDHTAFFRELNRALQTGRRPAIPSEVSVSYPRFVHVMQQCWSGDPADRPPFSNIANELALCVRETSA